MSFANPFGQAKDAAAQYVTDLIGRLEGRDPTEVMAGQVAELRALVAGVPDEVLETPEAPGKWSAKDVIVHLFDSEVVYGYRMRYIVAQPGGEIAGYDQDRWVSSLHYHKAPLDLTLQALDVLRRWNLAWIDTLSADERARWGEHSERGEESIDRIIQLLGAHDLVHRDQIARILKAVG